MEPVLAGKNGQAYHREAVSLLRKIHALMGRLGQGEAFARHLASVRAAHKPKRNFMRMLDHVKWEQAPFSSEPERDKIMAVEYVNRQGRVYYLLQGTTKTGKRQFYFAMKPKGELADAIPEGYEIYEEPEDAQVFLRKRRPRKITELEQALLEECIRRCAKVSCSIVDADGDSLVVYLADIAEAEAAEGVDRLARFVTRERRAQFVQERVLHGRFTKVMRFRLVDARKRLFSVERWCFRGSIDNWITLDDGGTLRAVAGKYVPHLGQASFFELSWGGRLVR